SAAAGAMAAAAMAAWVAAVRSQERARGLAYSASTHAESGSSWVAASRSVRFTPGRPDADSPAGARLATDGVSEAAASTAATEAAERSGATMAATPLATATATAAGSGPLASTVWVPPAMLTLTTALTPPPANDTWPVTSAEALKRRPTVSSTSTPAATARLATSAVSPTGGEYTPGIWLSERCSAADSPSW